MNVVASALRRDQNRTPGVREHHMRDAAEQRRGDRAESAPTAHDQPRVEFIGDLDDPAPRAFPGLLHTRAGVIAVVACALHPFLSRCTGQLRLLRIDLLLVAQIAEAPARATSTAADCQIVSTTAGAGWATSSAAAAIAARDPSDPS
jgi:hypothetical protein